MSLMDLYRAIKTARKKPKGIAVSTEMWNTLKKAGVLEMKSGYNWGLFKAGEKFPFFQGDISIIINPALDADKIPFLMPADSHLGEIRSEHQERRKAPDRRKGPRRRKSDHTEGHGQE
jgi:hypothetical protein